MTSVVVAVVGNPYMIIVVIILAVVLLISRLFYIHAIRDIKRLEALGKSILLITHSCKHHHYYIYIYIARSPLYSHISATLQGLPTIRSYCMESTALDQFHTYCNQHS